MLPADPSGSVIDVVAEFTSAITTPDALPPEIIHSPVSPAPAGLPIILREPLLSGQDSKPSPASATVIGKTLTLTV